MKKLKRIGIVLLVIFVLLFGFLVWFDWRFSMEVVEGYEKGDPQAEQKVLIATQGSDFKNEITEKLSNKLVNDRVFVKVIDVTTLENITASNWNAIVVMHTWEKWQPQADAETFLNAHYNAKTFVVMSTSASGEEIMENIDGISAPSILEDVDDRVEEIYLKVKGML